MVSLILSFILIELSITSLSRNSCSFFGAIKLNLFKHASLIVSDALDRKSETKESEPSKLSKGIALIMPSVLFEKESPVERSFELFLQFDKKSKKSNASIGKYLR